MLNYQVGCCLSVIVVTNRFVQIQKGSVHWSITYDQSYAMVRIRGQCQYLCGLVPVLGLISRVMVSFRVRVMVRTSVRES